MTARGVRLGAAALGVVCAVGSLAGPAAGASKKLTLEPVFHKANAGAPEKTILKTGA